MHEGDRFKLWVESSGMSQSEILELLGKKSRTSLYKYYTVDRFRPDIIALFREKLGYDVLEGKDELIAQLFEENKQLKKENEVLKERNGKMIDKLLDLEK